MPEQSAAGKILFLGKRHYTNKDALEERFGRIFHLPAEWAAAGRRISLWLIDYHGGQALRRRFGSLDVQSTPVPGLAFLGRLLRCVAGTAPGVVVASGDCYIGFLGWLLARLKGARFVFDVYDKYDEFGGYVRPLGFDLFGFLLRRADLLMFASHALARSLCPGVGHLALVPNGVDGELFKPMDAASCRAALGLDPTAPLIGYFGGMEDDRGVNDLVAAVQRLRDAGTPATLLLGGKRHPATALDRDWIDYRGMIAHDRMPHFLNACDVLVVPYRLSDFMDMGASCKIAEYFACGRPVVSTATPNLLSNFPGQAAELGAAVCRAQDPEDLARALAMQLRERRVASPPAEHLWPGIARRALQAVQSGGAHA
jgi:glycosyltransferase involved in cell wall biosynthesis